MMKIPFYTSVHQDMRYGEEIRSKLDKVIKDGIFILGPEVKEFEKRLATYMQVKHAVGVGNGSDALYLAVKSLNLTPGTEVITTPFTFFASTSCIVRNQLKPIFVDIDETTFHITPEGVEKAINKNTSAILTVDLFSHTADNDGFSKLSKSHNLKFIEDAAEAFGMAWNSRKAGSLADVSVQSFFPTKTLGAFGDAGALLTQSDEIAAFARTGRVHGAQKKYHHDFIGLNSRMDETQAAILNTKFNHVEDEIIERSQIRSWYQELLGDVEQINLPKIPQEADPVWYVYSIIATDRDKLAAHLNEHGIGTSIYYPVPMHLQKCFVELNYKLGDFPKAEKVCSSILALPIFPGMSRDQVNYISDCIQLFYKNR